jgi:hypothetical protein
VQSRTALVEETSGLLRLLRWDEIESDLRCDQKERVSR